MRPGLTVVSMPGALPAGFGLLVVCLGTLVVPFDSAVNVAFPHIVRALSLPIPAIQWVVIAYTLTYAALMLVFGRDRRYPWLPPDLPVRHRLERAGIPGLRRLPQLRMAAGRPRAARRRRGDGAVLRPGAGHQPLPRIRANANSRVVHDGFWHRRGARIGARRPAGGSLGLAVGVLVPRTDQPGRLRARLGIAAQPATQRRRPLRPSRRIAAGAGGQRDAAGPQPAAASRRRCLARGPWRAHRGGYCRVRVCGRGGHPSR